MKSLKKTVRSFVAITGCILLSSCNKEWDRWKTANLTFDNGSVKEMEIPYTGETKVISFKSNSEWHIVSNYDWISFNKTSGTGDGTVEITIAPNYELKKKEDSKNEGARIAKINFMAGGEDSNNLVGPISNIITITQESLITNIINFISLSIKDIKGEQSIENGVRKYKIFVTYNISVKNNADVANTIEKVLLNTTWTDRSYNDTFMKAEDASPKMGMDKTLAIEISYTNNKRLDHFFITPSVIAEGQEIAFGDAIVRGQFRSETDNNIWWYYH